jgi:cold shock CspA family protein
MREHGTLLFFDRDRDYGFIRPDDNNSGDVMIHANAFRNAGLEDSPFLHRRGIRVSYDKVENHNRPGRYLALSPKFGDEQ